MSDLGDGDALLDSDARSRALIDQMLEQAILDETTQKRAKPKSRRKKKGGDILLERIKQGDGIRKDEEDLQKLANTFDPNDSPGRKEKSQGKDNAGYEDDDVKDAPVKKRRPKKKLNTEPEEETTFTVVDETTNKKETKSTESTKADDTPKEEVKTRKKKKKKAKATEDDEENQEEKGAEPEADVPVAEEKKKRRKKKKPVEEAAEEPNEEDAEPKTEVEGAETTNGDEAAAADETDNKKFKKGKGKSKGKDKKPAVEEEPEETPRDAEDVGKVLSIVIHRTDHLKMDFNIQQPLVRVHIVDESTGKYLSKQKKDRAVTSYFETKNNKVDTIIGMQTQPFDFKRHKSTLPVWEELLLFNENFDYLIQHPKLLILFELVDMVSMNHAQTQYNNQRREGGWHYIAWGFLKLRSRNKTNNTDRKLRLQLYQPQRFFNQGKAPANVYQWWKSTYKVPYPSTLYVTAKGIEPLKEVNPTGRSMFALQPEEGTVSFEQMQKTMEIKTKHGTRKDTRSAMPSSWARLPGQTCRIPNTQMLSLAAGKRGAFVIKFSNDGNYLACCCQDSEGFPILIYEIPSGVLKVRLTGHYNLIYDVSWSTSGRLLATASSDSTVRIWNTEEGILVNVLPHPAFVYSVRIHPHLSNLVVTAGFDKTIRAWHTEPEQQHGQLVQEIEEHNGYINALSFDEDGSKLYSADSLGVIKIWNCHTINKPERRGLVRGMTIYKEVNNDELTGVCINSLYMHPKGRRMLVHTRDNMIRVLDLRTYSVIQRYVGAFNLRERLRSVLSPCGSFVISGSEDCKAYAWNAETGDQVAVYTELHYRQAVTDVDYHPHDHVIAFSSLGDGHPVCVYKYDPHVSHLNLGINTSSKPWVQTEEKLPTAGGSGDGEFTLRRYREDFDVTQASRWENAMRKLDSLAGIMSPMMYSPRPGSPQELLPGAASTMGGTGFDSTYLPPSARAMNVHTFQSTGVISDPALATLMQRAQPSRADVTGDRYRPEFTAIGSRAQSPTLYSRQGFISMQPSAQGKPQFSYQEPSSSILKKDKTKVIALYSYRAQRADELTLRRGDIISVLHEDTEAWWMGELLDGSQGYFPTNYVVSLDSDEGRAVSEVGSGVGSERSVNAVVSRSGQLHLVSGTEESDAAEPGTSRTRRKKQRRKPEAVEETDA